MKLSKQQQRMFYDSKDWKDKRQEIKERDNFECQACKRKGKVSLDVYEHNNNGRKKIKLVVHHLKELEYHPDLALDDENLETLCVECHNQIHDRNFKTFKHRPKNKWADDEFW